MISFSPSALCCHQSNGFQFQVYVIKKVLQRVLKNAYYGKGTQANVQHKCASLIRQWAASYGTDARMKDFVDAKRDLDRQGEADRGCNQFF